METPLTDFCVRCWNLNFTYKILTVLILTAFPMIGGMQIVSFYVINYTKILKNCKNLICTL